MATDPLERLARRAMTLAEYRAMEAEGRIDRPLTWGPQTLRRDSIETPRPVPSLIDIYMEQQ